MRVHGRRRTLPTVSGYQCILRRLTIRDQALIEAAIGSQRANRAESHLDEKDHALVQLAAVVVVNPTGASYSDVVERARGAGASDDELIGTLLAAMPIAGVPCIEGAAAHLERALGRARNR
jgi:alkylhydroperoxidase/carboxymuconolactone decarboxylase family protein YurZ